MRKFLKRAVESPFIILLTLLDLLINILEKVKNVLTSKVKLSDMLSQIDWSQTYDIFIRVVLTILLWRFYVEYVRFKRRSVSDFEDYKKKKDGEYQLLKMKIIAINKIMHDADNVILELFEESRDRQSDGNNLIIKSLNRLGDKTIHVKDEDPEITKYKNKVNEKMDEIQDPYYRILNEWNDDAK